MERTIRAKFKKREWDLQEVRGANDKSQVQGAGTEPIGGLGSGR